MAKLTINGKEIETAPGVTILEAAQTHGIHIPTLCYAKDLLPFGACRMCVVSVTKFPGRVIPACTTPVEEGMIIVTDSEDAIKARKAVLELMLINHPLDCPVCDKAGECDLQDQTFEYAVSSNRFEDSKFDTKRGLKSPLIEIDNDRCVLCGKCVRTCDEIMGVGAIDFSKRGFRTRINTNFGEDLVCDFCGNCVEACPVGSMTEKPFKFLARSWEITKVETVCSYCGVGCTLFANTKDNKIVRNTGLPYVGVNDGYMCAKGRFGYAEVESSDRLDSAYIRRNGQLVKASLEDALEAAASGLKSVIESSGPDAVAGLLSERVTNEEAYAYAKLMKGVIGTANIDHNLGFTHAPISSTMKARLGIQGSTARIPDLKTTDLIIAVGDPSESHSMITKNILSQLRVDKEKLILIASRSPKLGRKTNHFLEAKPGTEIAVLNGLMNQLIQSNSSKVSDADFSAKVSAYSPEQVEMIAGVSKAALSSAAGLIAKSASIIFILPLGAGNAAGTAQTTDALIDLALITGKVAGDRNGLLLLGEKSNTQGLIDMGVSSKDAGLFDTAALAATWGSYPAKSGLDTQGIIAALTAKSVKALYLIGEDIAVTAPNRPATLHALDAAEFVIMQDAYMTETAKHFADVIIPVVLSQSKDGTKTNLEGRVQRVRAAVTAPAGAIDDLAAISGIAQKLGSKKFNTTASDIRKEVSALIPGVDHKINSVTTRKVVDNPRLAFVAEKAVDPGRFAALPVNAIHHSGTMTVRSALITSVARTAIVELSHGKLLGLGIAIDEIVKVKTAFGEFTAMAQPTDSAAENIAFITVHHPASPAGLFLNWDFGPENVTIEKIK